MPEPILERGKIPSNKPEPAEAEAAGKAPAENPLADLQRRVGNRAVQRLIQRSGSGQAEVDEETAERIDANRGGGQELDPGVRESMGAAMGRDFSDVRVHTSHESDELNQQLGARAFTTGNDLFFSDGAYEPDTSGGKELLAHELTHVVQQGSGQAGGGGGAMTVNEPGDAHEQEADAVAARVASAPVQLQEEEEMPPGAEGLLEEEEAPGVQRQGDIPEEEEEDALQRQPEELDEEEMLEM